MVIHIDDGPQIEYECSGTPVDYVKLAVSTILERKLVFMCFRNKITVQILQLTSFVPVRCPLQ